MMLRLYDLGAGSPLQPRRRTRMALAHKGLAFETIPWRFTEKAEIAPSRQELVPVLVDGEPSVADSWTTANYLEDTYPDSATLS